MLTRRYYSVMQSVLFQPPVDYGSLKKSAGTNLKGVYFMNRIQGMCYFSGKLYITGYEGPSRYSLSVYSVPNVNNCKLLCSLFLNSTVFKPCVDRHSGLVYIPCDSHGVYVVRYDGRKLVHVTTLRCGGDAVSLAVVSSNTLYVCDRANQTVCLVDVTQDRVTARLQPPLEVRDMRVHIPTFQPLGALRDMCVCNIAVMGDNVLVLYEGRNLVIYQHGVPTPGKVLPWPQGLKHVRSLTTDNHFSFLLCGDDTVYVLDVIGNLTHTIPLFRCTPWDCTVLRDQLWVASNSGDIIVMSSSR